MGYAVCHRDATGTLQVDDVASLDEAVEVVERLRNEDGPRDVRVFREVPIEVRTYYKVVIADDEAPAAVAVAPVAEAVLATPAEAPVDEVSAPTTEPVPVLTATPAAPVEPLPGAFPLASPPPPVVEVHDLDQDAPSDASRRSSLFSRGG